MNHKLFTILLLALGLLVPSATLHAQKLRSDDETARALPAEWRDVAHLPDGFPADFQSTLTARIPDGKGGALDLSEPPSDAYLAELRQRAERGELFDYYFLPSHDRYRNGPGHRMAMSFSLISRTATSPPTANTAISSTASGSRTSAAIISSTAPAAMPTTPSRPPAMPTARSGCWNIAPSNSCPPDAAPSRPPIP